MIWFNLHVCDNNDRNPGLMLSDVVYLAVGSAEYTVYRISMNLSIASLPIRCKIESVHLNTCTNTLRKKNNTYMIIGLIYINHNFYLCMLICFCMLFILFLYGFGLLRLVFYAPSDSLSHMYYVASLRSR